MLTTLKKKKNRDIPLIIEGITIFAKSKKYLTKLSEPYESS